MSDTIPETVAAVLDHDAKATPGPWNGATDETGDGFVDQVKTGEGVFIGMALHAAPSELGVGNGFGSPEWADNAALIAYYRTAAPALAREVGRLEAELEVTKRTVREVLGYLDKGARPAYGSLSVQGWYDVAGIPDQYDADADSISGQRNTARAECERLRAGLVEALEMARHDRRCWQELSSEGTCTCSTGEAVPRLRALAEVPQ